MSLFAKIQAAAASHVHAVAVPEWGGETIRFRRLDGEAVLVCEDVRRRASRDEAAEWKGKEGDEIPLDVRKRRLKGVSMYCAAVIAACAVDEAGEPLFVGADRRAWLESQDFSLLQRLKNEVFRFTTGEAEEGEANEESGPSSAEGHSPSASSDPTGSGVSTSTPKKSGRGKKSSDASSPGA